MNERKASQVNDVDADSHIRSIYVIQAMKIFTGAKTFE